MALPIESAARVKPVVVEHPIGCPICGQKWVFVSDAPFGIGKITAVHPPGPCVARVYEWEPDDYRPRKVLQRGGNSPVMLHRFCAWCRNPFDTYAQRKKCCSAPCRKSWRRQANRATYRRAWQRRAAA